MAVGAIVFSVLSIYSPAPIVYRCLSTVYALVYLAGTVGMICTRKWRRERNG